jgi:TetR/AcrR family transcriptional regulator, transcriptional repressor for nem operon
MPKPNVRNKLLITGLNTVHRLGFNGCSVQDIAQAADVPKGSFYNHFESKEAFGAEILDLYWQNLVSTNLGILSERTISPIERLRNFFDSLAIGLADFHYERGCLFGNLGAELSTQSILVRDRLSILLADWTRSVENCICDAQKTGEINADIDATILAAFLINAWEGAVIRSKIDRDEKSLKQFNEIVFSTILA